MRMFKCDECEIVADARYLAETNAAAPEGWLLLSRWGAATDDERAFEFCSSDCLIKWVGVRNR